MGVYVRLGASTAYGRIRDGNFHTYETLYQTKPSQRRLRVAFNRWKAVGSFWVDDVVVEEILRTTEPGLLCLTGNATGELAKKNTQIEGTYIYYDGLTNSEHPPFKRTEQVDSKARLYGPVPLKSGSLTDGRAETWVEWDKVSVGPNGKDVVFDLRKDYFITRVEVESRAPVMTNVVVFLRRTDSPYYVAYKSYRKFRLPEEIRLMPLIVLDGINAPAHHVRLNVMTRTTRWGSNALSLREIRIWGTELGKETSPESEPYSVQGGKPPRLPSLTKVPEVLVFPRPQDLSLLKGRVVLKEPHILYTDDCEKLAKNLKEEIAERLGVTLSLSSADTPRKGILLGTLKSHLLKEALATTRLKPVGKEEGYSLATTRDSVLIVGSDIRGVSYGTRTLLQLLSVDEGTLWLPSVRIRDYPSFRYRWVMTGHLRTRFERRLLKALVAYKLNIGFMVDRRAPPDVCDFVKSQEIDIGITLPRTTAEITEKKENEDLNRMPRGRQNPCPSNPATYELYELMIGEGLKALPTAKFAYSSHFDEYYQTYAGGRWNVCALCKARKLSDAELMAGFFTKLNAICKKYGLTYLGYSTPYKKIEAVTPAWKSVPSEIIWVDYYGRASSFMVEEGFRTIGGVNFGYPGFELNEKLLGLVLWNWSGYNEQVISGQGGFKSYLAFAERTWSNKRPASDEAVQARVVAELPRFRRRLSGIPRLGKRGFFTIDLRPYANRSLKDTEPFDGKGWVDLGPNFDLEALPAGKVTLAGVPFEIIPAAQNRGKSVLMLRNRSFLNSDLPPAIRGIRVAKKASSLIFLHAAKGRPESTYLRMLTLAGWYRITYEDGTSVGAEIRNGKNVIPWDTGFESLFSALLYEALPAWFGTTEAGTGAIIYAYEWLNPYPQKTIATVDFCSNYRPLPLTPILLGITGTGPADYELRAPRPYRAYTAEPPPLEGKPIDWRGGTEEVVEERFNKYIAPDGTVVTSNKRCWGRSEDSKLAHLFADSNLCATSTNKLIITISLPNERTLTGFEVVTSYEQSRFAYPRPMDYIIEVSKNGEKWEKVAEGNDVCGEDGVQVHHIQPRAARFIRLNGTCSKAFTGRYRDGGFAFFRVYTKD